MLATGESSGSGPQLELIDPGAVARVTELAAGGTATTCADLVPVDFEFSVRPSSAGAASAVISGPGSFQLPSSGRCAGPTSADLGALELPARKLGGHGYDLSGQTTFGAGPFTVTATSTVRALFNPRGNSIGISSVSGSIPTGIGPRPRLPATHRAFQENAQLVYRVQGFSGALMTSFAGLPAPLCDPLGACGSSGELSQSFSATGLVHFFGSRLVRRRVGSSAALRDLRGGHLALFDTFGQTPIDGVMSETLTRGDGTICSDRVQGSVSGESVPARRGRLRFVLGNTGYAGILPGGADPLRTRCPGPLGSDVSATGPLASAQIPAGILGAHDLTITFDGGGTFSGGAYGGERGGSVALSLVLVHASGGTSRVTVARGIPALP
jgi:hypothetical protein